MVDFVKIQVRDPDVQGIKKNPYLEWEHTAKERTGVVTKCSATFHGLTFEVKNEQYLNIAGSLHKYYNGITCNVLHNWNDFTYKDLIITVNDICNRFNLSADQCKLQNIEIGLNIDPGYPVDKVLRSVINHKGDMFTWDKVRDKNVRICPHTRYKVKIYNKGLQYGLQENILRFEVAVTRMVHLKKYGISKLSDITNYSTVKPLGVLLLSSYDDILLYDYTIKERAVPSSVGLILAQGRIPGYWDELKESNENNYRKKRVRFRFLVKKYGTGNLQETIKNRIAEKWNALLDYNNLLICALAKSTLPELTDYYKEILTGFNTSDKMLIPVLHESISERRFCLTCGRVISQQKPGSKFCSEKFVGEQRAHSCRNADSGHRRTRKAKIERWMRKSELPSLFDNTFAYDGEDYPRKAWAVRNF
jgi:hypothetical protein